METSKISIVILACECGGYAGYTIIRSERRRLSARRRMVPQRRVRSTVSERVRSLGQAGPERTAE